MEGALTDTSRILSIRDGQGETLHNTPNFDSNKYLHSNPPLASVDTIKQVIKHVLKNTGRNDEPSEQAINQAMNELHEMNKVPQWRLT